MIGDTIVDIIVWQKFKNTEKTPSPFFSVDIQLVLYTKSFFFLTTLKRGKRHFGSILNLCHIMSTIVVMIMKLSTNTLYHKRNLVAKNVAKKIDYGSIVF